MHTVYLIPEFVNQLAKMIADASDASYVLTMPGALNTLRTVSATVKTVLPGKWWFA